MKTQNKTLLIMALPLIGALYFAAVGIADKINTANEAALTELAHNLTELRQVLEKEKEASGLFLGNKGAKFASELLAQRTKTDKQIKELKAFILQEFAFNHKSNKYGTAFKQRLSLVLEKLGKLENCRSAVSALSINVAEDAEYYTDLITSLSDIDKGGDNNGNQRSGYIQKD